MALMIGGIALRYWAGRTLGVYFTHTLRVQDNQRIVTEGPYQVIRHPGYTGALSMWVGALISTANWLTITIAAPIIIGAYVYRIRREEAMLASTFGEQYETYQAHTWKMVSFIYSEQEADITMNKRHVEYPTSPTWLPWIWLGIAFLLALFSNGRWIIPIATWIAPVFFLRYIHGQKPVRGLVVGGLAMALVQVIAWQDMTPLDNGALYVLIFSWMGILFWVPYCVERLLSPRIRGFAATLVFPLAYTSVELVYTLTNPFLSNGSLAYTQYSSLPLIQIVSVTGIWGITFLVTWTASVIHWAWEHAFVWKSIRGGVGICAGVLVAVLLFGEIRLALGQPQSETVRVAAVAATKEDVAHIRAAEADPDTAPGHYQAVLDSYIARTRQQALAGAKIVAWDELAIRTEPDQEAAIVQQGQELARGTRIYLLMALRVESIKAPTGASRNIRENKAVLIGPDGEIIWEYLKSFPTPGSRDIPGDGRVPTAETPLGTLAASICFDATNPEFIRQAGRARVGLMLNPAWNHATDAPLQLHMAVIRAIENGFALLRPARAGFSAAADGLGHLVAVSAPASPAFRPGATAG